MITAEAYKATIPNRISYNLPEAAALIGISRGSLYTLVKRGEIKSYKSSGRRLVPLTELEKYVAHCIAVASGQPFAPPATARQKSAAATKGQDMRRAAARGRA